MDPTTYIFDLIRQQTSFKPSLESTQFSQIQSRMIQPSLNPYQSLTFSNASNYPGTNNLQQLLSETITTNNNPTYYTPQQHFRKSSLKKATTSNLLDQTSLNPSSVYYDTAPITQVEHQQQNHNLLLTQPRLGRIKDPMIENTDKQTSEQIMQGTIKDLIQQINGNSSNMKILNSRNTQNNMVDSINIEVNTGYTMPVVSKSKSSALKSHFLNFNPVNTDNTTEFQENVMHILDRSHNKYRLNITDDFVIDSLKAKKSFHKLKLSPIKNSLEDGTEQTPLIQSPSMKDLGQVHITSERQRNRLFQKQLRQSRTQSRKLTKRNKVQFQNEEEGKKINDHSNKSNKKDDEYFLPDIKDYHRIIEKGLEKLEKTNSQLSKGYDEWCSMIKLCFDGTQQSRMDTVSISSIELIRLHPVFNKLSFYGVRDFLKQCRLVKLRANQLLYRQEDVQDSTYIVVFGKLVLHHRSLGAIGVVGMGQTLGEETIIERQTIPALRLQNKSQHHIVPKKDAVYASSESYLFEFSTQDWKILRDIMINGGVKADFSMLERLLKQNYSQKNYWRQYKERAYVNMPESQEEKKTINSIIRKVTTSRIK